MLGVLYLYTSHFLRIITSRLSVSGATTARRLLPLENGSTDNTKQTKTKRQHLDRVDKNPFAYTTVSWDLSLG